ncbi:serine/threonine-protein kinase [Nisaea sp.]|uniref:serine/threonine protein kinase n=1 Tax=Nisaea sp. TaxID=2024842 RepID=UPI003266BB42
MSEVRKGKDLHLDRDVALKCLQPFQDPQRIIDEQTALQEVTSKHVVQLLDIVQEKLDSVNRTFLVIEYIDGADLQEFTFEYNEEYLIMLWQIASGLSQIHSFSVIHRDIKPGNIRIDQEGVAKIFDFGLARQQGVNNKTQNAMGTPLYIAPEMFGDSTINFTISADVFSFGVMALTLLKRQPPTWVSQLPRSIPVGAVAAHIPEFPASIADIIQRCLSETPDRRPSMHDVCSAISKILLKDKHTAQLVLAGSVSNIDKDRREGFPKVVITTSQEVVSGLKIRYDGYDFIVVENIGDVVANNLPIKPGAKLAPSCVIAFPRTGSTQPYFATFNVNQPEVLI